MMRLPLYHKAAHVLLAIVGLFFILYVGQDILVPLVFSLLLAILLNPVVEFLTKRKVNRLLAIILAILFMTGIVFGIFYLIGAQVSMFSESWPQLKARGEDLIHQGMDWASERFRISQEQMDAWIEKKTNEGISSAGGKVGSTILSISSVLVLLFLVPVYIFLFLFYKPLLLTFVSKVFRNASGDTVDEVLKSTKSLIQSYLLGLLIEMAIVATLDSTALLIIGVEYAIVLGVIGAIMNLIPYIGGVIAIGLPVIMSLLSNSPSDALFVVLAYSLIQLIDNNFLVPMIVASKVKVNALVSIIVVLIGGALWGVAGMFLAIPITAIIKVVCDRVPQLEPYGYLIGDDMPDPTDVFKFRKNLEDKNKPVSPPQSEESADSVKKE